MARENLPDLSTYDFDSVIDRRGTFSSKWDSPRTFGARHGRWDGDTIPMYIADMDFACAPAIRAAMHRTAEHGIYGYTTHLADSRYFDAVVGWYRDRHNFDIREKDILYADGSMDAIGTAIEAFSNPGDGVVICPPVYGSFSHLIGGIRRNVVNCPLLNDGNGYYTMDWDSFEEKCAAPTNRLFILCSPANPVGRVWTAGELGRIAAICNKHRVILISDELHCDIVRKGDKFCTTLSAAENPDNIIMITSINKTFNVAGLHCANVIIPDRTVMGIFRKEYGRRTPSPFAIAALLAAYGESAGWVDALNEYLDVNIDTALDFFRRRMPGLMVWRPQGTYMLWLDFSAYGINYDGLRKKIYMNANVMLQDGYAHDPENGEFFQRMSVACPKSVLEEALRRIGAQFKCQPNTTVERGAIFSE